MKITRKVNFRVVVEPRSLGDYGFIIMSDNSFNRKDEDIEKEYLNRCEGIKDEIKRHVDNVRSIAVDYDVEERCSFCGFEWEVDTETGEPRCCMSAVDEFNANKSK